MTYSRKTIKQPTQKLVLLEGLRGLAALLIVAFHATELFSLKFEQPFLFSLFEFGDSGVDFFFVLSGFFLAVSSFNAIGRQTAAKDFLFKRCGRIYPFYWLVSLCIIPAYFLMPSFGKGYETDIGVIIQSLLLIPQSHPPVLSVAWFLSHLLFFYLIFTAVILQPKIFSNVVFAGLSLSAFFILADVMSGFQLRANTHFLLDFIFSYYNLEFAAGCLVGVLFKRIYLKKIWSLFILSIGCLVFIIAALLDVYVLQTSSNSAGVAHYYELIAYGIPSILIVGGAAFLEKNHRIQINKWSLGLGTASFAIYLTHYPLLSLFTKAIQLIGINGVGFHTVSMIFACVVTVLIGCAIHVYVEKKLVSLFRKKLTYKRA